MYEGSGNNVMNDDDDMGDYSGMDPYGTNDMEEDGEEEIGSAGQYSWGQQHLLYRTECESSRVQSQFLHVLCSVQ